MSHYVAGYNCCAAARLGCCFLLALTIGVVPGAGGASAQNRPGNGSGEAPKSPPDTAGDELPAAELLLARSLETLGSKEALDAVTSRRAQGYMQAPGGEITITILSADPDKFLIRQHVASQGEFVFGFDGATLWTKDAMQQYRLLDSATINEVRTFDFHNLLSDVAARDLPMKTIGRQTIGGHDVYKVQVGAERPADEMLLLIDAESSLLRGKEIRKDAGPGGLIPLQFLFDEWKQFGDLKLFTKVRIFQGERDVGTISFTEIEHNNVEASTFDLPAEVKALMNKSTPSPGSPPSSPPPSKPQPDPD